MKNTVWTLTICLGAAASLFAADTNVLSTEKAQVSYAIGMSMGRTLQRQGVAAEVDPALVARGARDALSGATNALLTAEEIQQVLTKFQGEFVARQEKIRTELAAKNKAEADAFLATNKNNPAVVTLLDGLQYKVITNGTGPVPTPFDTVTVHYRGWLLDGTEFDNSYKRGEPAQFPVTGVIHGWREALMKMNVGSHWQLFVPPQLAYGDQGRPGIPPNAVLIFDIELLSAYHETTTSDVIKVPSAEELRKGAQVEVIKKEDIERMQKEQQQKQSPQTN